MAVQAGNIISSFVYRTDDAPYYHRGNSTLVAINIVVIVCFLMTKAYYILRNKQKERVWNGMSEQERKDYRRSSERAVMDRIGSVTLVTSHAVARIVAVVVEWCSPSSVPTSTPKGSLPPSPSPFSRTSSSFSSSSALCLSNVAYGRPYALLTSLSFACHGHQVWFLRRNMPDRRPRHLPSHRLQSGHRAIVLQ